MTLLRFLKISYYLGFRQRWTLMLALLGLVSIIMEALGLVLLVPIVELIQADGDVAALSSKSAMWHHLTDIADRVGLTVSLPILMGASLSLILLRQVFTYFKSVANQRVAEAIMRRIRVKGARAYLSASSAYHDRVKIGEVVNTLTSEAGSAGSALTSPARILGLAVISIVYIVTLAALSAYLTAIALGIGAVIALVLTKFVRDMEIAGRGRLAANDEWFKLLVRRLHAHRLIRIAGTQELEAGSIDRQAVELEKRSVAITRLRTMGDVIVEPILAAFALALLYSATQGYGMSIGEVGLFLVILFRLSPVAKSAAAEAQLLASNLPALKAVSARIRDMEDSAESGDGREVFENFAREIRFDNVTYRYPSRQDNSIKGVSFGIRKGCMTAIVGPSGAGKSTIIDLLFRIRDPDSGQILIDGRPLQEFTRHSVRRMVAYFPQSPQTLADTIAAHIAYGNDRCGETEIQQALQLAGADGFVVALPLGAETRLQETGSGLSGGQMQRVELARALARKGELLILDEPTSNLDANAETAFRSAIVSLRNKGASIVIVAHRLQLVKDADMIVVLDHGRVREQGRHEELLGQGGWYAAAWYQQEGGSRTALAKVELASSVAVQTAIG